MFNGEFDFDLDFLNDVKLEAESKSSIPKSSTAFISTEPATGLNYNNNNLNTNNEYSDELISLTKKIEKYNKVVLKLKKFKSENERLENHLQSLNKSAIGIKSLYEQENEKARKLQLENKQLLSSLEKAQIELNNLSEELSIKKFDFEQSKAELENNLSKYKEKILPEQRELYNKLGLKYVDMAKKMQEHNLLEQMDNKDVQRVINHLKEHSIPIKSLKRSPPRNKEKPMNTVGIDNRLNNIKSEIILDVIKPQMKTQGTQYISSSTTRSTCTSAFIKKHDFGSNFPEIVHLSVEQILGEMIFELPPSVSPINDFIIREKDLSGEENFSHLDEENSLIVSSLKNKKCLPNIESHVESDQFGGIKDTEKVDCISLKSLNNKVKSFPIKCSLQKKTELKPEVVHSKVKKHLLKASKKKGESRKLNQNVEDLKERIVDKKDLFNQQKYVNLNEANALTISPLKSEKLIPNIESDVINNHIFGISDKDRINGLESVKNKIRSPSLISSRLGSQQKKTETKPKVVHSPVKNHLLKAKDSPLKKRKSRKIHKNLVLGDDKNLLIEVKSSPNINLENICLNDSENIQNKESLTEIESVAGGENLSHHGNCVNISQLESERTPNTETYSENDQFTCTSLESINNNNKSQDNKDIKPKIVYSQTQSNLLRAENSNLEDEKLREIHKNSVKEDGNQLAIEVKSTPNINLKIEPENYSENIKNKEDPNKIENIEISDVISKDHTISNVLQLETTENHVKESFDMQISSSGAAVVEEICIIPKKNSIDSACKVEPKPLCTPIMDISDGNKNTTCDDNKLVELFGLSSSDTEELERSFECINDLSINKLFANDSTLEPNKNYIIKQVPDCKEIDNLSPIKSKDCVGSEQNVSLGKNASTQFNDLCTKINMLRESEKNLLDHEREVTFDATKNFNHATKLQTLKEIKNLLEESQVKENILSLLNGELSNYSLTNLWNLMGETIFKLIDHSKNSESSSQMQLELLSERIHVLSKQMENEKKSETTEINSQDKTAEIIDTYIDTRNSDVISPISELSSIEFLNTETRNSVETLTENEDFSSIFLEKVPNKTLKCEPCKRTLRSGKSYNSSSGKLPETKNIRNQKNKLSKSNLKCKLDAIFMVDINFPTIKLCDDKPSAVGELLKKFPTKRKRCRKSSDKQETNTESELEENENKFDYKKIKLDKELDRSNEHQLQQETTPERFDAPNAFCNSKEAQNCDLNVMQENEEKSFNNFVDRILEEFVPPMKMSPIQELPNTCDAVANNFHDDCLVLDIHDAETPLLHERCEDIVQNLESDFKSPESPPHFFQESNSYDITEIPLNPYNDNSPASPPMLVDVEQEEPILIPDQRIVTKGINCNASINSLLGKHISQFEHAKYNLIRHKSSGIITEYQTTLIKKLCGVLEHFTKSDGSSLEVQKCIIRLVKRSKVTKLICKAIVETVENISAELNMQNTPPCPSMTVAHQKMICLCNYLGKHIKGFTATLIDVINSQLFSLKNTKKTQFETLVNLTQLYIGIIDLISINKSPARLFICKCLYYYNQMAIPLIYQIIAAYPGILPHREDPEYDHSDPVITTIQCVLNALPYNMEKKDLRHPEMFHMLKLFYGYERVVPSKEQVIENFIAKLRAGRFRNLSYSFAVICKQNGVDWTERYVINSNLMPLVHEYFNEIKMTDKNDQNISALLEIVSFIIKPSDEFPIVKFQQIFSNFLYATDRKVVQESAVRALLRTSRFGLKNCFILLCRWSPTYNIEPATKIMMQSFMYKKPLPFWKNLLNETKS